MLSQRGLYSVVLRWLSKLYCSQSVSIKWGNCTSSKFHVTNGVKQGGVLSPLLFAVYIDKLLVKLKKSGIGCHIGKTFAGAFGYADDIILLSPTVNSIKSLYNMCHEFGREFDIKFNPEKSQFLSYGCQTEGVYLDGQDAAKHLGHMTGPMKN